MDAQVPRPTGEFGGQQYSDAFVFRGLVVGKVLSLEVGVDRHLGAAASAYRRDEIDGCDATPLPDQLQRLVRNLYLRQVCDLIAITNLRCDRL